MMSISHCVFYSVILIPFNVPWIFPLSHSPQSIEAPPCHYLLGLSSADLLRKDLDCFFASGHAFSQTRPPGLQRDATAGDWGNYARVISHFKRKVSAYLPNILTVFCMVVLSEDQEISVFKQWPHPDVKRFFFLSFNQTTNHAYSAP